MTNEEIARFFNGTRAFIQGYLDFEMRFAKFLDKTHDVMRFALLGATEQGESGTQFRVDYLKPSGAIGFYHPDWVIVQKTAAGKANWIIETKGRVWEDTKNKDQSIALWCENISEKTACSWHYHCVNQVDFVSKTWRSFGDLIAYTTDKLRVVE